nr:divalent-cation tolerance protein CutA [Novosphingobium sp.]
MVGALVWCPFPDAVSAEVAAGTLLDEGLIVCANVLPGMRSIYVWKGARQAGSEVGVLFKTTAALLDRVIKRLGEVHPYDEPAILGWRCDAAAPGTLAWFGALSGGGTEPIMHH